MTDYRTPTAEELARYKAEAEALRAETIRKGFVAFGAFLRTLPARFAGLFRRVSHG